MTAVRPMIRCREITEADIDAIADLLARGFVGRSRQYWIAGLQGQAGRDAPANYPRFGYMLDHDGAPVGVLLTIYTARGGIDTPEIWCNLSSWYVEPAFRSYATMLTRIAQRLKEVTYVNISPARSTWPILGAQGFEVYCKGLFFSLPALSLNGLNARIDMISAKTTAIDGLPPDEIALLARHASYGCLSVVCRTGANVIPFVFQHMRIRRGTIAPPAMQLIYCRDVADYVHYAGAIGRLLLRKGQLSVVLDANGPIAGLAGLYTEQRGRKYVRGPHRRRLADLADTELALYGP